MLRCVLLLTAVPLASALFAIEDDSFGEGFQSVHLKVLKNTVTGEYVEVAWNLGGRTESLMLRSPTSGDPKPVLLDSKRNASDAFSGDRAGVGFRGEMLIPYANRIKNGTYELNGKTYYMERNEDRSPWGQEGLHGYLYRKVMQVESSHADDDSAVLVLSFDFDGSDPGYPFPLTTKLTYKLDAKGFAVTTTAKNRHASDPLPFYNSWHSYFRVSDVSKAVLTLDRCSDWNHILVSNNDRVDGDMIPTGATEPFHGFDGAMPIGGTLDAPTDWDDEFKSISPAQRCPQIETKVSDPTTGDTSVLWSDWQFQFIQVFTGAAKNWGEQAIAVEAMSSACDAWNNMQGVKILQAGEEWEGTFGVRLEEYTPTPRLGGISWTGEVAL